MGKILLGIDVETTGLDAEKDRITEIAWAIFDTDNWKKPLECAHFYVQTGTPVPPEIVELTGITDELLEKYGTPEAYAADELATALAGYHVDFMVAQNAPFDRGFIRALFARTEHTLEKDYWIDTKVDIEYPKHVRARNLVGLCAEHGFLNPFPHSALFDVFSMMKLLSMYPIDDVLAYRAEPTVILNALVDFDNKDKAKKCGFSWQEVAGKTFFKKWVKAVKRKHVAEEKAKADFTIVELGATT